MQTDRFERVFPSSAIKFTFKTIREEKLHKTKRKDLRKIRSTIEIGIKSPKLLSQRRNLLLLWRFSIAFVSQIRDLINLFNVPELKFNSVACKWRNMKKSQKVIAFYLRELSHSDWLSGKNSLVLSTVAFALDWKLQTSQRKKIFLHNFHANGSGSAQRTVADVIGGRSEGCTRREKVKNHETN